MNKKVWTLSEVSRLLGQPQHRLIYLCEKQVIVPDLSNAQGRGSSRKFSARNIFEFSTALTLSKFHFPTTLSANFLYAIRLFESSVRKSLNDFNLPNSLTIDDSPEIVGIITEGSKLNFAIGTAGKLQNIFEEVEINEDLKRDCLKFAFQDTETVNSLSLQLNTFSNVARFEINLTNIARNLKLE